MKTRGGNAIVILIAVIGIVTMIGIYSLRQLSLLSGQRKQAEMVLDAELIRGVLRENLSCQKTLDPAMTGATPAPNCALASFDLKDHNNNVLSNINGWRLRGSCEANELKVEAELPDGGGGFVKNPITGQPLSFANAGKTMMQTIAGSMRGVGSRFCRTPTSGDVVLYRVTRKSFCNDPDTNYFTTTPSSITTGNESYSCVYEYGISPATWDCPTAGGAGYWTSGICSNNAIYSAHPVIQKACTSFGGTLKPGCSKICGDRPGAPQIQGITCPDVFVTTPLGKITP